jgi:hypothetical protein
VLAESDKPCLPSFARFMTPQFHVGHTIYLRPAAARNAAAGAYDIRAMLRDEGGQRRYRIRSLIEPHERVVSERELHHA